MSKLIRSITGMTDAEFRTYETPRVTSRDQINFGGPISRNVRVNAGLVVFTEDLERERENLHKSVPKCLVQRRSAMKARIKGMFGW